MTMLFNHSSELSRCLIFLSVKQESSFRFNIAVYHNVLARIKISAADAHILGDAPFKVRILVCVTEPEVHPLQ